MELLKEFIEAFKEHPLIMIVSILVIVAAVRLSPYSEKEIKSKKASLIHQKWKDTFNK